MSKLAKDWISCQGPKRCRPPPAPKFGRCPHKIWVFFYKIQIFWSTVFCLGREIAIWRFWPFISTLKIFKSRFLSPNKKQCSKKLGFYRKILKFVWAIFKIRGAAGAGTVLALGVKFTFLPILTWKNLWYQNFLVLWISPHHDHIGAHRKSFLTLQPMTTWTFLSRWSKHQKSDLKLDSAPMAMVLTPEPNFIWGVVHLDR